MERLGVAVLCALLIMPAALAFSAGGGPGVGGCSPDVDHDYRGLCRHTRHVVVNRTKTVHPLHITTVTATATSSADVSVAGGTTTVPGTTTTATTIVPGPTSTETVTATSSTTQTSTTTVAVTNTETTTVTTTFVP